MMDPGLRPGVRPGRRCDADGEGGAGRGDAGAAEQPDRAAIPVGAVCGAAGGVQSSVRIASSAVKSASSAGLIKPANSVTGNCVTPGRPSITPGYSSYDTGRDVEPLLSRTVLRQMTPAPNVPALIPRRLAAAESARRIIRSGCPCPWHGRTRRQHATTSVTPAPSTRCWKLNDYPTCGNGPWISFRQHRRTTSVPYYGEHIRVRSSAEQRTDRWQWTQ